MPNLHTQRHKEKISTKCYISDVCSVEGRTPHSSEGRMPYAKKSMKEMKP